MSGTITFTPAVADGIARVVLDNPAKLNAIDRSMWRELRSVFESLQELPAAHAPRAVIVSGAQRQFGCGGDIQEFASFRFDAHQLEHFHEDIVAPALRAVLACDVVLLAQIEGSCIGGALEIAACCDIRVCGRSSRFGAPIARLGFPMAPQELTLLAHALSPAVLREMLLEASLLDAGRALDVGLVHAVHDDEEVAARVLERARGVAALSPQALRINKRTLRQIAAGGPTPEQRHAHFGYADSAEHREGVTAFIDKRPPQFRPG
jgi:enoyl-CoA hydratase/carnithine racemase